MTRTGDTRRPVIGAALAGIALVAAAVFVVGFSQATRQLHQRGAADLALASDRLNTSLMLIREMAVLMADHPHLRGLEDPERLAAARALMVEVADKTGADDLFHVDTTGWVLASASGPDLTNSDLRAAPDFTRAMQGALGRSRLMEDGRRLFRYMAPVMAGPGQVVGVVGVIADAAGFEQNWPGAMPPVFFTDPNGLIFTANRSELVLGRHDADLTASDGRSLLRAEWMFAGHEIWIM